jgi:hypothetical protein
VLKYFYLHSVSFVITWQTLLYIVTRVARSMILHSVSLDITCVIVIGISDFQHVNQPMS